MAVFARTRCFSVAVLALTAVLAGPGPDALAQPFGPGACGGNCPYADNNLHTFYYNNVNLKTIDSIEVARTRQLNPTDMDSVVYYSSNADTDVIVEDGYFSTGPYANAAGVWTCMTTVAGSNSTKCNQGRLLINTRYGDATYARACHEIGHSVGLDHSESTSSCVYQPAEYGASSFSAHDIAHINGYY